ncbi:MAG: SDR family oxidoreductase [Chlamydiales bacterium]|nr:SDR family oxidoreductase [Chlamydiales bacterium]
MSWTLVTGAAQGLGAALALSLAQEGHNIVVHYNTTPPDQTVANCRIAGVQAQSIKGDFSSPQSVETFLNAYERSFSNTKGIVHNVGNWGTASASKSASAALMQTNLHTPEAITSRLLPSLIQNKGHVVTIGTIGIPKPNLTCTDYAITKAALWKYTLSLAKEVPQIKVNMVSPGVLENSITKPTDKCVPYEEVGHLVAYLFSTHYITGQNIEIAAGFGL